MSARVYRNAGLSERQQAFHIARRRMIEQQLRSIKDERVLSAMARIPRHLFVEEGLWDQAYGDNPLPIGEGQTISQPKIVAYMTEVLQLTGNEKVLEIGTGCGYQTSVLCELAKHVYSIERLSRLSNKARLNLYDLGYLNFSLRIGDGTIGWKSEAPFDAILIAAGGPKIPPDLCEQLADGGRMVVPVGTSTNQVLIRVTRHGDRFEQKRMVDCRFVKLIGKGGFSD